MRLASLVLAITALAPAMAHAEVFQERVIQSDPDAVNAAPANRILYVNSCIGSNGCTVTRSGSNSSQTNTSSIPDFSTVRLTPYAHGQAHFDMVMECVRDKMAMYDIQVTTVDPGTTPHTEIMAAGSAAAMFDREPGQFPGGIAPFLGCNGQVQNGLAFLFANDTSASQVQYLCTGIIHEAAHVWGVSHVYDDKDHMSYARLGQEKWWQNSESQCHDNNFDPMNCPCSGSTQNTFRTLRTSFGLAPTLEGSTVALVTPLDGAYVGADFAISGEFMGPLDRLDATVYIDGILKTMVEKTGLIVASATGLSPGEHTIKLVGTDYADRKVEVTHTVTVLEACEVDSDCSDADYSCLGGKCLPPSNVDGGLGATCEVREDCASNVCGTADGESYCTASCNDGACPDGYYCRGNSNGVCWPGEAPDDGGDGDGDGGGDDEGGCSTGGAGGMVGGLLMLGALVLSSRRRRVA